MGHVAADFAPDVRSRIYTSDGHVDIDVRLRGMRIDFGMGDGTPRLTLDSNKD